MIKQIELHSKTLLCLTQSHRFVSLLWNIRTFFWFGKCPFNFPIYMTPVEDILQTRKNVSFELWIFKIPFFCLFPTEQHIASLPLKYISNKRHKCLGSKDSLLFGRKCVFFMKIKCLSNIIMSIEHPVAINYCNDLLIRLELILSKILGSKHDQRWRVTVVT